MILFTSSSNKSRDMSTKKFTHSSIFSFNLLKTQTVLLFFLLNLIGALAHSGEVFSVGQPAIKKIKTAPSEIQINKKKPKNEISKQEEALQRRKVFQSLEERRYGEAHFSGIVMSRRRVQEAGGVDNCFVSIRITQLEPTRHQPLVGLKRGDIVRNVLDTPLCDLRVGSRAKGLLIDNNFFVDGERSLMLETF